MSEPTTMTVEQGKCQIYPDKPEQFCMRVGVVVTALKPGATPNDAWIGEANLYNGELRCSQAGLDRLIRHIQSSMKPPTKRQTREAKADVPNP